MDVKLNEDAKQGECRVYTVAMASDYPHKPPYNNCAIVCGLDAIPTLMETCVFTGTYKDCLNYVKENCNNCENCPPEEEN